jgi:preprotein translocase subunit SecA
VDEHGRNVELTDAGLEHVERMLGHPSLHETADQALLGRLNCALHARALLRAGTHYLVRDGRIELIDELTGRTAPDRRWPEGLQAAVEAKEGLVTRPEGQILSSMTLQTFLRGYPRLAGMTGTAREAAGELFATYGRPVVIVPPHRPSRRVDHADVVFTHRLAKEAAVVAEVRDAHASGRPVLVGTLTVDESERLAVAVRAEGVSCAVLNAVHDEDEAAIVARAGAFGAVTIATNMAGDAAPTSASVAKTGPNGRWSRQLADSTSSARPGTRACASIGSCGAGPAVRATRARRDSSSAWKTICSCGTAA